MNNDLIVMKFDNEHDALKAKGALEIIRNRQFLGVANAVPVTRDSAGKVDVHHKKSLPLDDTDPYSQIPCQFVHIFYGESDVKVQELVAAGLDDTGQNPGGHGSHRPDAVVPTLVDPVALLMDRAIRVVRAGPPADEAQILRPGQAVLHALKPVRRRIPSLAADEYVEVEDCPGRGRHDTETIGNPMIVTAASRLLAVQSDRGVGVLSE